MRGGGRSIGNRTASSVGFNLLPWRQREMRRRRRHRLFEWCAALLLGCACVAPLAAWQLWLRGEAEAKRETLEQAAARLSAPLAEARRLESEATAQRTAAELAQQRAKPLKHLVTLFDALASEVTVGVVLQQVEQHDNETELQATAADETAAAAWLERLRTLPEAGAVNVRELKRAAPASGAKQQTAPVQPIRVIARLVWRDAATAAKPVAASSAREKRTTK
jgi:Tfp pilus assembly protein PilN